MPETMEMTCERAEGEPRGGFGIAVDERKGSAWVGYTVGAAKAADLIRKGDKITHIDGKGPLSCAQVCEALKKAPESARVTVVRGEPMPRKGVNTVSVMSGCTVAVLVCAMSWTALDLPPPNELLGLEASLLDPTSVPAEGSLFGSPAAQEPQTRGPAMRVNGKYFQLSEDGSAVDPHALRAAMRADKGFMAETRKNSPDWAGVIAGGADGAFDETAFQRILRKNWEMHEKDRSVKLNDDGTAVDPEAYLRTARQDKKWMKQLKAHPDAQLREEILKGNPEALNRLLSSAKQGQAPPEPPAQPPPPPTPYDDVGQVQMSFRILTDEGEEKDLYQLSPTQSEEEKWDLMPRHLKCAACQASAHQGALAVAEALRNRYKDDLVGVTALEAMQGLCDNAGKWTSEYGLVPTKTGVNAVTGPGITARKDELLDGQMDLMLQKQHSSELGRKLGEACKAMLLGADLDEDELAAAVMDAEESDDDEAASRTFIRSLCEQEAQPCAASV